MPGRGRRRRRGRRRQHQLGPVRGVQRVARRPTAPVAGRGMALRARRLLVCASIQRSGSRRPESLVALGDCALGRRAYALARSTAASLVVGGGGWRSLRPAMTLKDGDLKMTNTRHALVSAISHKAIACFCHREMWAREMWASEMGAKSPRAIQSPQNLLPESHVRTRTNGAQHASQRGRLGSWPFSQAKLYRFGRGYRQVTDLSARCKEAGATIDDIAHAVNRSSQSD